MRERRIQSMKLTANIDTLPTISEFFRENMEREELRAIEQAEREVQAPTSIYEELGIIINY